VFAIVLIDLTLTDSLILLSLSLSLSLPLSLSLSPSLSLDLALSLSLPSGPQLFNKVVFLVSFVGNQGTFTRGYQAVVMDMLFIYHLSYALICVLGLFAHEFFYSFLVRKAYSNRQVM